MDRGAKNRTGSGGKAAYPVAAKGNVGSNASLKWLAVGVAATAGLAGLFFSPVMAGARRSLMGGGPGSGAAGVDRDPRAVKRVDHVHLTLESNIGEELRKQGVQRGEAYMPAPTTRSEFQEATYTATIDGKPMEVVKDLRGRDVLHFTASQSSGIARIAIDATLYQADKREYSSSTPKALSAADKRFYLHSDSRRFAFNTPAYKAEMVRKGLEAHQGETAYEYNKRIYDYYFKNSRYTEVNVGSGLASNTLRTFVGGDCKDYTILFMNLNRANGFPCKGNITFPIVASGNTFHGDLDVFSPNKGWFSLDPSASIDKGLTSDQVVGVSQSVQSRGTITEVQLGNDVGYLVKKGEQTFDLGAFMHGFDVFTGDSDIVVIPKVTHDFTGR